MRIFFAITCYDHKIFGECSEAILKNCLLLMNAGHTVSVYYSNDLYIDRSRNMCAYLFLEAGSDKMVFIDSDMTFDDDAILKLVNQDKDIVGGAYRYKDPVEGYPVTLDYSRENNCKEEETGLVYATRLPTGLMCIKKEAFGKLIDHYKMVPDERKMHQFFRTGMLFEGDDQWWGEDTYFGKRWTDMGETLFIEPNITITHIGLQFYKGNFHDNLMGRRVEALDQVASGVPGWMSESELRTIDMLASQCESIVEVGSWKGRTTEALLKTGKAVIAVDHWKGSEGDLTKELASKEDVYEEFQKNVGYYPNLTIKKGNSVDVAKVTEPVDMVFLDAGHTYEELTADIDAWLPKCKKIIAGHDYHDYDDDFPEVVKAVNEKFGDKVLHKDSIWWVEV